ncbi:MAG: cobalamin-dependent protein [Candidatus Omnitrophica bacterium]|nr:cobalamin-dependent protein [Candidatus Omnitrophota bacterium]
MSELSQLAQLINELKLAEVKSLASKMIEEGASAQDILVQCQEGMAEIGRRFDQGECFIPELVVAGKIMEAVMKDLEPLLKEAAATAEGSGAVVMGTVMNDVHDIGKDIVVMMLRGSGFRVIDLGVNVSPEKFVEAVKDNNPAVIGMSVLLTTCYQSISKTVEAIQQAGLRDHVSIMLGGAAATEILAQKTGCDFYGKTAMDAVVYASQRSKAA